MIKTTGKIEQCKRFAELVFMHVCVCTCVCVRERRGKEKEGFEQLNKVHRDSLVEMVT